jgi:hypothetical protein
MIILNLPLFEAGFLLYKIHQLIDNLENFYLLSF